MRLPWLLLAPLLLAVGSANVSAGEPARLPSTRPAHNRDPWIFRCVLDGNARMIVISLGHDVWVAYDANGCALAKVWQGDVNFTGPVYDTRHGPQPQSRGALLLDRRATFVGQHPFQIITGLSTNLGQPGATSQPAAADARPKVPDVNPAFAYRGYTLKDDVATLHFQNVKITVDESPTVRVADDGKLFFRRTFAVAIPTDQPLDQPDCVEVELPTSPQVASLRVVDGSVWQPTERGLLGGKTLVAPADVAFAANANAVVQPTASGAFTIETELTLPATPPADQKK